MTHFFIQGLIQELVEYNLRRGTALFRSEVRQLLALLTRDNVQATQLLNDILMSRITASLKGHRSNPDLVSDTALYVHWSNCRFTSIWVLPSNLRFLYQKK